MRTLVARKDAEHAAYRFVVAREDGRVCCAGDDVAYLCEECQAAPRALAENVPPVTFEQFHERIRELRGKPRATDVAVRAPQGVRPGLEAVSDGSVNAHGIPNPPKLVARR